MKDTDDAIPVGMISIRDAFDIVYQTITPDRQTLEERLNPSSPYYGADQNQHDQHVKDRAYWEAWRNLDQAELNASKVLREKLSQGTLVARFGKGKKKPEQISRDRWASMSDFEAMQIFNEGKAIVRRKRRVLYFDPKNFDDFMKEIRPPDGDRAAHPGERAPSTSQARAELRRKRIRDFCNRRWPDGYTGSAKDLKQEIREFGEMSDKTIERALASLKSRKAD
jgi:hypothetical protein